MRLHYAEVLNPRKVCALAKHVGAPVDYVRVDLRSGAHRTAAFRALNPNSKVPVLEDGATTLWEADAIMCHLAVSAGSHLWPQVGRQAEVIRWLSWNQAEYQPLGGTFYFERVIKPMFGLGEPDPATLAATLSPFRRCATMLNAHLEGHDWLVGDAPTIADFSVASVMPYREAAELPLDAFPAILRWNDRLMAFDAWRDPYPADSAPP